MVEIEDRLDRLIRETWDSHLDVLALMMAENRIPRTEHVARLDTLVLCFRRRVVEETIFEDGRRVPTVLDDGDVPMLRVNSELLSRVADPEILFALARPIATILGISALSVSLALQTRDGRSLKNLANKASRKLDEAPVRSIEVPAYLHDKMAVFGTRLSVVSAALGGSEKSFVVEVSADFHAELKGVLGWPEWVDVSDALRPTLDEMAASLHGTPFVRDTEAIIEQIWDGLAVGSESFLRNAGRGLRNCAGLIEILAACSAAAAATDDGYSDQLATWPNLVEIYQAWTELNRVEETVFGVSTLDPERKPVSVLMPARRAFGLEEPTSLPWDLPVLCWSAREQNALRDLFVGVARMLPSAAEHEFFAFEDIWKPQEAPLKTDESRRKSLGLQVVAIGMELLTPEPKVWARAWSAALRTALNQFEALSDPHQHEVNRMLRRAYDDYFPESTVIWARRFYDIAGLSEVAQFEQLATEIQRVLNAPVFFDPFVRPIVGDMAPFPTLTFTVALCPDHEKVPVWIPLSALASTVQGAPIRVRAIEVNRDVDCQWLCDRSLHLNKLKTQPVDLIVRSVHGDALQFAIFE